MTRIEVFQKDFENEAVTTRKMLAVVPNDKYDWKPHPKSMSIRQLATHLAELPLWIGMTFNTNELDFEAMDFKAAEITDTAQLLEFFDKNVEDARTNLASSNGETLDELWTLRSGNNIYSREPKADVIRMSLSQTIHHRAQLGVFLRLLDVAIPGSYGPSADEDFIPIEVV